MYTYLQIFSAVVHVFINFTSK